MVARSRPSPACNQIENGDHGILYKLYDIKMPGTPITKPHHAIPPTFMDWDLNFTAIEVNSTR